jgi:hypothetical protein
MDSLLTEIVVEFRLRAEPVAAHHAVADMNLIEMAFAKLKTSLGEPLERTRNSFRRAHLRLPRPVPRALQIIALNVRPVRAVTSSRGFSRLVHPSGGGVSFDTLPPKAFPRGSSRSANELRRKRLCKPIRANALPDLSGVADVFD